MSEWSIPGLELSEDYTKPTVYKLESPNKFIYKRSANHNQMVVIGTLDKDNKFYRLYPEKHLRSDKYRTTVEISMWEPGFYTHERDTTSYSEFYRFDNSYKLINVELGNIEEIPANHENYVVGLSQRRNIFLVINYYDQYLCSTVQTDLADVEYYSDQSISVSNVQGYRDSTDNLIRLNQIDDLVQWAKDGKVNISNWEELK